MRQIVGQGRRTTEKFGVLIDLASSRTISPSNNFLSLSNTHAFSSSYASSDRMTQGDNQVVLAITFRLYLFPFLSSERAWEAFISPRSDLLMFHRVDASGGF